MNQPIKMVLPDPKAMVHAAAQRIVDAASHADAQGDLFALFLSGGSTPRALYQLLASEEYLPRIDWRNVELYFGDERCVPPDSPESNWRMAHESLISRVPIPASQVFRIRGEIDPREAAKEYGMILKEHFEDGGADLMLLGMGADGHTASLFPGTAALLETDHRVVANHVPHDYIPRGTNWRVTVTFPFINRSKQVLILCAGADKADKVRQALQTPPDPARLPIQGVQPASGQLLWMLDAAAAAGVESSEESVQ